MYVATWSTTVISKCYSYNVDNNIAFPTATTRLSIDYGEDNHSELLWLIMYAYA